MPLSTRPKKPCKHCGEKEPRHWAYQCRDNPKKPAKLKQGKRYIEWRKFRKQYLDKHPPNDQGYYECYLCGKWIEKKWTTLDHVIPRSNRPDLAFDESNIKTCCFTCNTKKGSQSLDNYRKN